MFNYKVIFSLVLLWAAFFRFHPTYFERTQPLPAYGSTPELFLEWNAAERFAQCGFLRTFFLPDYSTTKDCSEKPYVYTHMPSGPSVFLGVLLQAGMGLNSIRLIFAAISFLGLVALYFCCLQIFASPLIALFVVVYTMGSFDEFVVWSDHFVHAFFAVAYFGALFCFFRESPKKYTRAIRFLPLLLALITNFICAVAILVSYCLIALFRNQKGDWQKCLDGALLCVAVISLHLLRNALYLGFDVAAQEILWTLSNRILAVPSRAELASFYQQNGIVLWGADRFEGKLLSNWLFSWLYEYQFALLLLIFSGFARSAQKLKASPALGIVLAILGGLFAWYLIFWAHGQYYTLPFITRMAGALLIGLVLHELAFWQRYLSSIWTVFPSTQAPASKWFLFKQLLRQHKVIVACFCLGGLWFPFSPAPKAIINIFSFYAFPQDQIPNPISNTLFAALRLLERLPKSAVVWSNIDAPVLAYFTQATVVGSCTETAFRERDVTKCFGAFLQADSNLATRIQKPNYFFFAAAFEPGSLVCRGECTAKLAWSLGDSNRMVAEGPVWWFVELK